MLSIVIRTCIWISSNCASKSAKISLNLDKCAFIVFSGMILGLIVLKEGKLLNPKKIQAIIQMHVPTNP